MQVDRFNHKQSAKFLYKIRKQLPGNRIDLAIWKDLVSLKYSFRGFMAFLTQKSKEVLQRYRLNMLGFNIG
jgi:hypothetical protein